MFGEGLGSDWILIVFLSLSSSEGRVLERPGPATPKHLLDLVIMSKARSRIWA